MMFSFQKTANYCSYIVIKMLNYALLRLHINAHEKSMTNDKFPSKLTNNCKPETQKSIRAKFCKHLFYRSKVY